MTPIVVCTVHGRSLPILEASVRAYCPDVSLLSFSPKCATSGLSYTAALKEVYKIHDEAVCSSDDIVVTPDSYRLLMEDVERLKQIHGDKLGLVAAYSDCARVTQNIRHPQSANDRIENSRWTWENECRRVPYLSPFFAWQSKKMFEEIPIMPIDWYSDDIFCIDAEKAGYAHYISRAYVHHAGSQTLGNDSGRMCHDSMQWIEKNRPDMYPRFKR